MRVSAEGTPMLKLAKGVFDTQKCTIIMTYLLFGICAIYITCSRSFLAGQIKEWVCVYDCIT